MSEQLLQREDAQAALAARGELGADYDDALVDSLVDRIEARLAARVPRRRSEDELGMSFVIALVSLACGIPITAFAIGAGGLAALAIAWAGIVLVNLGFARLLR